MSEESVTNAPAPAEMSIHAQAATKCRERINTALRGASVAFYDMSMGLLEAYENEYPRLWGFENFTDYVERELDMKYRSAYYMVEIGQVVRQLGIDKERVQRIGWTKLKEVAGILTDRPEESEKYLSMAESMSTKQLKDALQSEVTVRSGSEAHPALMRLSLKFEGDTAGILSDGLALAYGDIGKEDASLALSHIVGEWLIARGSTPQASTLEDWIAYIKNVYGVELVRAESSDALDSLLIDIEPGTAGDEAVLNEDDAALEELLR